MEFKIEAIPFLIYKNLGEGLFVAVRNCQIYKYALNTSVYETLEESEILYPNPSSEIIFIKKEKNELLNYEITDITSRVYLNGIYNQKGIIINELPSGLYFLKIFNGYKFSIYKFLKI